MTRNTVIVFSMFLVEIGLAAGTQRWPDNDILELIFWICSLLFASLLMALAIDGVRHLAKDYRLVFPIARNDQNKAVAPVSQPAKTIAEKRTYSPKEKEQRYEVWTRIYAVLDKQFSEALDDMSRINSDWRTAICASPKGYTANVAAAQKRVSASFIAIHNVYKDHQYLTDIRDYFENGWGDVQNNFYTAIAGLLGILKDVPDAFPPVMLDLLDHRVTLSGKQQMPLDSG